MKFEKAAVGQTFSLLLVALTVCLVACSSEDFFDDFFNDALQRHRAFYKETVPAAFAESSDSSELLERLADSTCTRIVHSVSEQLFAPSGSVSGNCIAWALAGSSLDEAIDLLGGEPVKGAILESDERRTIGEVYKLVTPDGRELLSNSFLPSSCVEAHLCGRDAGNSGHTRSALLRCAVNEGAKLVKIGAYIFVSERAVYQPTNLKLPPEYATVGRDVFSTNPERSAIEWRNFLSATEQAVRDPGGIQAAIQKEARARERAIAQLGLPRGEFETTAQYNQRKNGRKDALLSIEQAYQAKVDALRASAPTAREDTKRTLEEGLRRVEWDLLLPIEIGSYDADEQTFSVSPNPHPGMTIARDTIRLHVPVGEAEDFRASRPIYFRPDLRVDDKFEFVLTGGVVRSSSFGPYCVSFGME